MAARRMGLTAEQYRKQQVGPAFLPAIPQSGTGKNAGPTSPRLGDIQNPQRVTAELAAAKLLRAIYSERQLNEAMVDFWFNHFNVFAGKGPDRWFLTSYERDTIRPYALGKFRDLLLATAKSPAMLFYLDNWLSAGPQAENSALPRRRGLNENYGRELMELHTLGVDGGYTQKDVVEVARCFTGWTLRNPVANPVFFFNERIHDQAPKTVLGRRIEAGGMRDGEEVLDILARHPSTAKFISTKLARRFVSDNPPPSLVARMAKTFLATDGDIRSVVRTMIYSPEFWSREAYRAKVKTPFELVASAARALEANADDPLPLINWTARIGEPLYQCLPPTGYSDQAQAWVNTGALLNRLNFTLALAQNRLPGEQVNLSLLAESEASSDPLRALDRALQVFLGGQVSPETRAALEKQIRDAGKADPGMIAGLVLGSPEFQRR